MKNSSPSTENAFVGVTPQTTQSPSILTKKMSYDVFINHRGCDVKHKLASNIYHTLTLLGFRAFLDAEELELGDCIPLNIEEAMRSAVLHIAILSKKYAESPWCLAELSFMLKTGTKILPVFYHVQPDHVRWVAQGKGIYASAFSEYQKKKRYSANMLEEWKGALQTVSNLKGYMFISDTDDEGKLLKYIVDYVKESIPSQLCLLKCLPWELFRSGELLFPRRGGVQVAQGFSKPLESNSSINKDGKFKIGQCNVEERKGWLHRYRQKHINIKFNKKIKSNFSCFKKVHVKDDEDEEISTRDDKDMQISTYSYGGCWKGKDKNSKQKLKTETKRPKDVIINQNKKQEARKGFKLFYLF